MQVQQMIRTSAEVLTITRLEPGNVYKRVVTDYTGTASLRFGVVQSVMNNGADAAVTAIEFAPNLAGSVASEIKVFDSSAVAAIFPATPDEISAHFIELEERVEREVAAAEKALEDKHLTRQRVQELVSMAATITAPETSNILPASVVQPDDESPELDEPAL
jgi:hypothetical protein